jgi:hypothetical protein
MQMVVVVISMSVVMMACVQRPVPTIGTTLRLERPLHFVHMSPQPFHHLRQHVIRLDEDGVGGDLRGRMPIAEVPGDTCQRNRIRGVDLE